MWIRTHRFVRPTAGCSDKKSSPPPTITSIVPNPLCSDGTTFMIKGTSFDLNATVTVDGNAVQNAMVTDSMDIAVTVPSNTVTGGAHTVTVTNPDKKSASGMLTGEAKPLMFFVDPNVLGANMTTPRYVRRGPTVPDAAVLDRFLTVAVLALIAVMTFAAITASPRRGRW